MTNLQDTVEKSKANYIYWNLKLWERLRSCLGEYIEMCLDVIERMGETEMQTNFQENNTWLQGGLKKTSRSLSLMLKMNK